MKLSDFSNHILLNGSIEDKLTEFSSIEFDHDIASDIPKLPIRNQNISFSSNVVKFPRGHFHEKEKKAIALHSFANHELLAIEMMACALRIFPHHNEELKRFKRGILSSLKDEQKHFKLYCEQLNKLGYEFGDFDLNDFFWNQMKNLDTPQKYLAVMSLTFEAANLDFAHFYKHIFLELGEIEIADVLNTVLVDEISHVNLGVHYLNKWKQDKTLWEYYNENLPWPLTPARSKGKNFIEEVRRKASMDDDFIFNLKNFDDQFKITTRKEWKK